MNQTNSNHVKIITTRSKYNTLDATGEKQFHIMLKDTGDGIAILNEPACLLLATGFMHSTSQNKGSLLKSFTLSEIRSSQILDDHFRRRSYLKKIMGHNMTFSKYVNRHYVFKFLNGNLTTKISVQKNVIRYINVTGKYFELIILLD